MSTGHNSCRAKSEGVGSSTLKLSESKDVPVRLSVLKHDPNFTPNAQNYNVHFNGEKQTHCIIADSENGYILRYKKTILGTLRKRAGKLETEEVFGNVVITKKVK